MHSEIYLNKRAQTVNKLLMEDHTKGSVNESPLTLFYVSNEIKFLLHIQNKEQKWTSTNSSSYAQNKRKT